ncbi:uncharacterized protein DDB_G0292186-like isoform X2 [Varroa jacobsoni]|uniref:uncharacterized protein DDB_G0292186-like isoform X2 n=1 Tax=Varroa jacobsoni TaxID=62625 RepID=UPI000BF90BFE|nr:uncharacterized protein DDB_G0292186-like isoform X2 [Varroa jacobsoni]
MQSEAYDCSEKKNIALICRFDPLSFLVAFLADVFDVISTAASEDGALREDDDEERRHSRSTTCRKSRPLFHESSGNNNKNSSSSNTNGGYSNTYTNSSVPHYYNSNNGNRSGNNYQKFLTTDYGNRRCGGDDANGRAVCADVSSEPNDAPNAAGKRASVNVAFTCHGERRQNRQNGGTSSYENSIGNYMNSVNNNSNNSGRTNEDCSGERSGSSCNNNRTSYSSGDRTYHQYRDRFHYYNVTSDRPQTYNKNNRGKTSFGYCSTGYHHQQSQHQSEFNGNYSDQTNSYYGNDRCCRRSPGDFGVNERAESENYEFREDREDGADDNSGDRKHVNNDVTDGFVKDQQSSGAASAAAAAAAAGASNSGPSANSDSRSHTSTTSTVTNGERDETSKGQQLNCYLHDHNSSGRHHDNRYYHSNYGINSCHRRNYGGLTSSYRSAGGATHDSYRDHHHQQQRQHISFADDKNGDGNRSAYQQHHHHPQQYYHHLYYQQAYDEASLTRNNKNSNHNGTYFDPEVCSDRYNKENNSTNMSETSTRTANAETLVGPPTGIYINGHPVVSALSETVTQQSGRLRQLKQEAADADETQNVAELREIISPLLAYPDQRISSYIVLTDSEF